jgi:hypothetical protein
LKFVVQFLVFVFPVQDQVIIIRDRRVLVLNFCPSKANSRSFPLDSLSLSFELTLYKIHHCIKLELLLCSTIFSSMVVCSVTNRKTCTAFFDPDAVHDLAPRRSACGFQSSRIG